MISRLTFYCQQIIIGVFIFNLSIFAQHPFQTPGFADVATYISDSYVPPLLAPPKSLVKNLYTSICLVKIVQNNGTPFYQSGVLFDKTNNLVVTSMHGFLYPGYTPVITPTSAKVYFGYMSGGQPSSSDPNWCTVNAIDPTPNYSLTYGQQTDQFPLVVYDFIVLKLDKVPANATAAHVTLPFDKTYFPYNTTLNRITSQPAWPFFLAHPYSGPMYLSYDPLNSFSQSIDQKMYGPTAFGVGQYLGWNGSSGGGLFWSNASVSDSRCGDLLGIVCNVSDEHWPYQPGDGPKPWPYIKSGPTMGCVFDKTHGAKNLIPYGEQSDNLSSDDLNTVWTASSRRGANITCPYKYEPQHDAYPNIWFAYGTDYNPITQSFPMANILPCNAPKGHYAIFIEMMKSTWCTNANSYTDYSGSDCKNLSTSSYPFANAINIYSDIVDGPINGNSNLLTTTGFGITDFDFYQQTNWGQRHNANEDFKYSDVIKFQVADIFYDPSVNTNKTLFIKLKTALRYNVGNYDVTQGLSVHSIKAVYKDAPLTSPSIITTPASPDQANYDECRCKTFQYNLTYGGNGYKSTTNGQTTTDKVYIDWKEKSYKSVGDGSYDAVDVKSFTGTDGKTYNVSANHCYTINSPSNFDASLYTILEPYASNTNYTDDDRQLHRNYYYGGAFNSFPVQCPSLSGDPILIDTDHPDGKITGTVPFYLNLWIQNLGGMLASWSIDWGDGYKQTSVPAVYPADHVNLKAGHSYSQNGVYSAVLSATGKNNSIKTLQYAICASGFPPSAVSGLSATPTSSTEITLNWTDNANDYAGFFVEKRDATGNTLIKTYPVDKNTPTFKATGLLANTSYQFVVYAWNACGNSQARIVSALPIHLDPPLPLTNLTATIISQFVIKFDWINPPNNTEDGFDVFDQFRRETGASKGQSTAQASAMWWEPAGTTYNFTVQAYNQSGRSYSNTITITLSAPPAPSNLVASTTPAGILLTWKDNSNNESGFTINWSGGSKTINPNQTSITIPGLSLNTPYQFTVKAFNGIGTSAVSNTATATPISYPAQPSQSPSKLIRINGGTAVSGKHIQPLYISNTEVSQMDYYKTTNIFPSQNINPFDWLNPVDNVSYYDAIMYCNAKSIIDGLQPVYSYDTPANADYTGLKCTVLRNLSVDFNKNGYRLPTPDEWEYAYMAGTTTKYYWGSTESYAYLWMNMNSNNYTHPIATKLPNAWGLYDMAGNAEEWTWSDVTLATAKVAGGCFVNDFGTGFFQHDGGYQGTKSTLAYRFLGFRIVRKAPDITPILQLLLGD